AVRRVHHERPRGGARGGVRGRGRPPRRHVLERRVVDPPVERGAAERQPGGIRARPAGVPGAAGRPPEPDPPGREQVQVEIEPGDAEPALGPRQRLVPGAAGQVQDLLRPARAPLQQRPDVAPLGGQQVPAPGVVALRERVLDEPFAVRPRARAAGAAHARSRAFSRCHCTVLRRPASSVTFGTQRSVRRVFSMFTTRRRMLSISRRFVCCGSTFTPTRRTSSAASSLTRGSTPVPTLNTSPTARADWAASTVASTASSMYVKSRVWLPSPWITGGLPENSDSMNLATTPQ